MSTKYYTSPYYREVLSDVSDYITGEIDLTEWQGNRDGLEEYLNDVLWISDSVTGNASGSYYCNSYRAMEMVTMNISDLIDACREFGIDSSTIGEKFLDAEWEWMDVTVRCYFLSAAVSDALDNLEDILEADAEETEEA